MNKCLTLNGPWTKQAEADKTRFFEEAGDFLPEPVSILMKYV